MSKAKRNSRILPGFGLSLGYTLSYLSLVVLIPLSMVLARAFGMQWRHFWAAITSPRVLASYKLSFGAAIAAALVNAFMGLLVAWVLVRYRFPGRRIMDTLIDLPFALPTAVAGIALTAAYSPSGWIGHCLEAIGVKAVFTPLGVVIALVFVGLPFVVRTVQPVLENLSPEFEEAALSLGASRRQAFGRVILPELWPAVLSGFALALARGIGEYGSVVFISGNMPMRTEIAPLLIFTKLEQYDYSGAAAIAVVMLAASFGLLLLIQLLQRRGGAGFDVA